ncbi:putative box C/D snoRNA protein SPCC613.07 [Hordeum vulgare subsp. vulgare]|uniref:Box C/D snoRNA protein 1 n=1 Tax=Hordeum vulgare subsp. vulgare TaxID=112509 RepID=A0A8I7B6H9_HORVV|nr:putative box C/D snoRNA protein SPCC613.07 [Hordeum vulgare subsp. vulgare]
MEGEPPPTVAAAASGSGPGDGGGGGEKGAPCQECGEQPWKYRCPGCSRLTCSLPCVQAHKRRAACSGKRPRTDPVALAQFDDTQLLSDYNLLEETSLVRESAHRLLGDFGGNFARNFEGRPGAKLPPSLGALRKAAERRGVRLFFLPRGMTRRAQNRSRHDNRNDCIYWTIEWKFNSTDIVLTDHQTDENASLLSLLEKHLSPSPWKDELTPYRNTELRDLKLFIQRSAKDSKSPHRQLNIEEPFRPQLRGTLILEYPTISVFLPSDSYDFRLEKLANKISRNEQPPSSSNDSPPLEGTEFQEEEIEEGEFAPETQVIDLRDCGPSRTTNLSQVKLTSEPKMDSMLSYVHGLASGGKQGEVSQHGKMASSTAPGVPEAKSCMKVYPVDLDDGVEGGTLEGQVIDLENHATSDPGNIGPPKDMNCETDYYSVLSPISILASEVSSRPEEEGNQESGLPPKNATPEALRKRSLTKVYPLDMDDDAQGLLLSELPSVELEQEMGAAYEELFGDMNPDDFLGFDLGMMDVDDGSGGMTPPLKLWDDLDLEEGEIPSQP